VRLHLDLRPCKGLLGPESFSQLHKACKVANRGVTLPECWQACAPAFLDLSEELPVVLQTASFLVNTCPSHSSIINPTSWQLNFSEHCHIRAWAALKIWWHCQVTKTDSQNCFKSKICVGLTESQRKSDQEELLWRKSLTPTNWVMNKSTETDKRPLPVTHIINTHGDPNRLPCHHDTWHCQYLPRNNRSIDQNLLTGQHGKVSGQIQSSDSEDASYTRKTSRYVWKSPKFWNHQVVVFWITCISIGSTKAKQSLSGISYGGIQVYGLGLCVIWLMPWDDIKVRQS
jgi:hypothetical protein